MLLVACKYLTKEVLLRHFNPLNDIKHKDSILTSQRTVLSVTVTIGEVSVGE